MTIDSIDHSWITQTFLVKQHFTSLGIQNSWLLYSNSKIGRRRKKSRRYYDRSLPAISNFPIVNHFWCSSHHQPGSLFWHVTTTMVGLRTWPPSPTSILSPGSLETMEMGNGEQKNKKKRAINIDYDSDSNRTYNRQQHMHHQTMTQIMFQRRVCTHRHLMNLRLVLPSTLNQKWRFRLRSPARRWQDITTRHHPTSLCHWGAASRRVFPDSKSWLFRKLWVVPRMFCWAAFWSLA